MLALAPLAPDAAPLDAGERFALDLLLDLSCVLRTNAPPAAGDAVRLRVEGPSVPPMDGGEATRALAPSAARAVDGEVVLDRRALRAVHQVAGGVAEQHSARRDRYDRVPSSENALVQAGESLEREPVVSVLARAIATEVHRAAGRRPHWYLAPWPEGRRWAAALTHDLDVVQWWPAFTALRLAELAKRGEGRQLLAVLAAVVRSGGRQIVWRGVRDILAAERAHAIRSTWFVLCGTPTLATARTGDLTYRAENPQARRILAALSDGGHEIGLHGSFATSDDPPQFALQRERLAQLVHDPVAGVRQHYLRLRPATTPSHMMQAGFAYDSTAGFADRNGFRLGVADVVPSWSEAQDAALPLDEAPFCWMDRALSKYRGIEQPSAWIDDALRLADRCRAVQGMFVGIWHPNLVPALGFPGAPAAYARLAAALVARDAYIAPLGELVAWRHARRRIRATGIGPDGRVVLNDTGAGVTLESAADARVRDG